MIKKKSIKRNTRQIIAITEKNILLELRIKAHFITRFLNPVIQLLISLFLFQAIFNIDSGYKFGYWDNVNYMLFLFLAFCVQFSRSIIDKYYNLFFNEKFWKTLSALMIAPFNRFNLLIGVLVSEITMISIPFIIIYIITIIFYPISIFYIFLNILVFFAIFLTFSAIGLLIGVFSISYEELTPYSFTILRFVFLLGCINFPLQIFPEVIQNIILLNPFYYFFDLLRLTWYLGLNYEVAITIITPTHILVVLITTIISPIISIYLFEYIYKKYGITGY